VRKLKRQLPENPPKERKKETLTIFWKILFFTKINRYCIYFLIFGRGVHNMEKKITYRVILRLPYRLTVRRTFWTCYKRQESEAIWLWTLQVYTKNTRWRPGKPSTLYWRCRTLFW
jgi:hypothetical protein